MVQVILKDLKERPTMLQVHIGGPDGTDGSPAGTPVVGTLVFRAAS